MSLTDAHVLAHDAEHRLTHEVPRLRSAAIHAYPAHARAVARADSRQTAEVHMERQP